MKEGNSKRFAVRGGVGTISSRLTLEGGVTSDSARNFVLLSVSSDYFVLSDDFFDTGYFPRLPVGFLSDDDPREAVHAGDTLTLEMDCIEEAYYNFVTEAQLEIAGSFPLFSGPPANVTSNIDNGAQVFFCLLHRKILAYCGVASIYNK